MSAVTSQQQAAGSSQQQAAGSSQQQAAGSSQQQVVEPTPGTSQQGRSQSQFIIFL